MAPQTSYHSSPQESERTRRLRDLGLNDPSPDVAFDRFAQLAASSTRAPVAMVNFVNDDRQMFRGLFVPPAGASDPGDGEWSDRGVAFDLPELSREMPIGHGFCPHVVATSKPLALDDILAYPRFRGNPVVDELGVRAYLGAPLVDDTNTVIGTVCVIDMQPREWGRDRLAYMQNLADALLSEIRLRDNLVSQRQGLFAVLDSSPVPIMLTSGRDHLLYYANSEYDASFGQGQRGIPGPHALPQLARAGLFKAIEQALNTGVPTTLTNARIERGNGYSAFFTFKCTPMTGAVGGISNGVLTAAMDVTAQSQTEQELAELASMLRDRLQHSGRGLELPAPRPGSNRLG